ncbi:MAG: glutamyl-tRNA reductase [Planctomycetota bacterium]
MNADLHYLGLTLRTASPAVRERLRCDESTQWSVLVDLQDFASERMVLSTCERFEMYASGLHQDSANWVSRLGELFEADEASLQSQIRVMHGDDVMWHLFRVAGGLDSRLIGEPHILGQVRHSFLQALECGTVGPILSAMGRAAIFTGRRIRRETPIHAAARSSATLAVDWVRKKLGSLGGRTVLLVGTGRLATDVAGCLAVQRSGKILVVGRNLERAEEVANNVGGEGLTIHQLVDGIRRADAIITCTASPTFLVDRRTMGDGPGPLAIVDLGVPRNVDPAVSTIEGVTLCHLDDLADDAATSQEWIAAAEGIVSQEVRRTHDWLRARAVAPAISALIQASRNSTAAGSRESRQSLHFCIRHLKEAVAA